MEYTLISENKITVKAYAKINLYLDVTGKREDGYHQLETVMHTVSIYDTVTIETGCGDTSVKCSDSSIPADMDNIAHKAAILFFEESEINDKGTHIYIDKHIPSQAGMGGGSADAAAVFFGLNVLYGEPLSPNELLALSVNAGADVPFCLAGGCGYCTGIGDVIEPLPVITGYRLLIAKGSEGISTKSAFQAIDSLGHGIGKNGVKNFFSVPNARGLKDYCRNIFDEVTDIAEIRKIRSILISHNAYTACMTGSGSAVFGIFPENDSLSDAVSELKCAGYFAEICRFI
ncbi:MAG: 4-(cytidine 5'-diphospho)-2-C-methyl-D-erythritol kinase [Huintestinicola sp.]